jgi:hypothetical protein
VRTVGFPELQSVHKGYHEINERAIGKGIQWLAGVL